MIALAILGLIAGVSAGARFQFSVLIPAVLLGIAEVAFIGFVQERGWTIIVESMLLTGAGLQIGYIGGALMRLARRVATNSSVRAPSEQSGNFGELPTEHSAQEIGLPFR
jgi:hypothetical protein